MAGWFEWFQRFAMSAAFFQGANNLEMHLSLAGRHGARRAFVDEWEKCVCAIPIL